MPRITFIGAGSSVFAKNVLGDCVLTESLKDLEFALYDIDSVRLKDSEAMMTNICKNAGRNIPISTYLGTDNRKAALKGAKYVVNAVQVGGYDPCTITDFEIPKKYGLRQTIADTLGIGGIFRALRTIPVLEDLARDMEEVCPDALFLNYSNPMCMLTGYIQRYTGIKTIGLCHSVQICVPNLLDDFEMKEYKDEVKWKIAGINHQAWLLEIRDGKGNDLYPIIKEKAANFLSGKSTVGNNEDRVRYQMMLNFGHYITESSEHTSEYVPYFIKSAHPELIERYNIPLDEYPRRCIKQIEEWKEMRKTLVENGDIKHEKSHEYAAFIIDAMENDTPYCVNGNVLNTGLITNLPSNACVEVPCLITRGGVQPTFIGDLPEQCAALNRTNINVQLMTIKAAKTKKREDIYMAAMLDPHTSSELTMDEIKSMCDDMIEAHGDWMKGY